MRTRPVVAGLIALAAAIACGPDGPTVTPPPPPPAQPPAPPPPPPPPPPQPPPPPPSGGGTATVSLTTPNTDDGAILLELQGAGIHALRSANSAWQAFVDSSSSPIRVVVAGPLQKGALLTFTASDTTALRSYAARIVEVASRQNQLRSDVHAYALTIGH